MFPCRNPGKAANEILVMISPWFNSAAGITFTVQLKQLTTLFFSSVAVEYIGHSDIAVSF